MRRTAFAGALLVLALFQSRNAQALPVGHPEGTHPARGISWVQLTPKSSPTARDGVALAYDPVSQRIVLFGGADRTGYPQGTWTFDGSTWTRSLSPIEPAGRAGASMAYDAVTRRLVLYGGFNGTFLKDTWLWDGAKSTWNATGATPVSPRPLTGAAVFTDRDGHVTMFGGSDGQFYQSGTWHWTGLAWKPIISSMPPTGRSFMVAAENPALRSAVIFGGLSSVHSDNTWTWDGGQWTEQALKSQPAERAECGSSYDPVARGVVAFGGATARGDLNDTWLWTGAWVEMKTTQQPSPRNTFGMAYDSALGHVIVFGGRHLRRFLGDTWELVIPLR